MRQPRHQPCAANLLVSVSQVIPMKRRCWLSYAFEIIRSNSSDWFHRGNCRSLLNPTNPSHGATGGTPGHRGREQATTHRLARVSTTLGRLVVRTDSDKVARGYNGAAH